MELNTTNYKDLLSRFDTHIFSKKSIKSGNHYTGHAKEFLGFLERQGILSLKKVDELTMKSYFNYLIARPKFRGEGPLSPQTVNDNLSTIRMFSLRMQEERLIDRGLSVPKNIKIELDLDNDFALVRQVLTIKELKEVYSHCQNETERALIALAYGSGLRRGSLINLTESNIDFKTGIVTAIKAKNNKTYSVPISDHFLTVLRDYSLYRLILLSEMNMREKSYFIDQKGRPLSGDKLNEMLKRIIGRTGNRLILDKKITLHCLRHSIAVHLMDAGESFEYVKTFLGHSFADTSLIYAKRRKLKNQYAI
jgi:site-specific recombinase XerD